ncbi:MAG: hypothetical protein OSB41_04350 [Kiritimatiellae bacterium]|nr:hypothetical protein [Kiritimatiellia bacterium]
MTRISPDARSGGLPWLAPMLLYAAVVTVFVVMAIQLASQNNWPGAPD